MAFVPERMENIDGIGENAGYLAKFAKAFFLRLLNPLPENLDWSKLKQFADDILKCI